MTSETPRTYSLFAAENLQVACPANSLVRAQPAIVGDAQVLRLRLQMRRPASGSR